MTEFPAHVTSVLTLLLRRMFLLIFSHFLAKSATDNRRSHEHRCILFKTSLPRILYAHRAFPIIRWVGKLWTSLEASGSTNAGTSSRGLNLPKSHAILMT
jgi:hypothetical protein